MKKCLLLFLMIVFCLSANGQSCDELIKQVKSTGTGTSYSSYTSDAIAKVTFYQTTLDYQTYYFAIVCFKQQYSYNCSEYIYLVGSNTKLNYSLDYHSSAGKAFWKHINPYAKNLKCSPKFD